jgi:nucleoside-diphosphate-sugar epimerase
MKIFLTGGSGFIGTNLVTELLRRGDTVLNFDSSAPGCAEQVGLWKKGDLLDAGAQ